MSSTEYNLYYFDIRGLAEPIRYILSYGGANWKDHRLPYTCFQKAEIPEDFKSRCPYGSVPVLEFEGNSIAQSAAIGRYLARQYKLTGKDEIEAVKCDEVIDALKDFALWMPAFRAEDKTKMQELMKSAVLPAKQRFLSKFNQMIEENGGHIVGKSLTWADIWLVHTVSNLQIACPISFSDEFPALKALIETVFNEPKIKEWIEKRPLTMF